MKRIWHCNENQAEYKVDGTAFIESENYLVNLVNFRILLSNSILNANRVPFKYQPLIKGSNIKIW